MTSFFFFFFFFFFIGNTPFKILYCCLLSSSPYGYYFYVQNSLHTHLLQLMTIFFPLLAIWFRFLFITKLSPCRFFHTNLTSWTQFLGWKLMIPRSSSHLCAGVASLPPCLLQIPLEALSSWSWFRCTVQKSQLTLAEVLMPCPMIIPRMQGAKTICELGSWQGWQDFCGFIIVGCRQRIF